MSLYTELVCDRCAATVPAEGRGLRELRRYAREGGWTYTAKRDLCHGCQHPGESWQHDRFVQGCRRCSKKLREGNDG